MRRAFTLIEVLIVVAIMAIIAAIIMPQIVVSALDSRDAALLQNLNVLRQQISLFKLHHDNHPPGWTKNTAADHFALYSNAAGDVAAKPDPSYPYGPYVQGGRLTNPFNGAKHLKISANPDQETPNQQMTDGGEVVGWFYSPATGQLAPNAEGANSAGTPRIKL